VGRFVPALEFNGAFYAEAVAPLLDRWPHSAARLGFGSEVLGFDTERSTDHGWGPNLLIFVAPEDVTAARAAVEAGLPATFAGWPVWYHRGGVTPVTHHVVVESWPGWLRQQLGRDPTLGLSTVDWLLLPQQKLLEVTRGAVYRDDESELARTRQQLSWYPDPVWLWMIACQWRRIAQEEAFVGRAAEVGDELGSRVVAARLVREVMRLWFLFHRSYWPYSKWFGSAFRQLPDNAGLLAALSDVLAASSHPGREAALAAAYEIVAARHNGLGITDEVEPTVRPYYGRPFRVLMADRFVEACLASLGDHRLAAFELVGSVDQVADSTDLLSSPERVSRMRSLYGPVDG